MLRTERLNRHVSFLKVASALAEQSTCARRAVGCVLTDSNHHIVGSGYNGTYSGASHCITEPCGGHGYRTGEGLDVCQAIHAEQNALMQCRDVHKIATAYVTAFPCGHCIKLLLNTSCKTIYYIDSYSNGSLALWLKSGRVAIQQQVTA